MRSRRRTRFRLQPEEERPLLHFSRDGIQFRPACRLEGGAGYPHIPRVITPVGSIPRSIPHRGARRKRWWKGTGSGTGSCGSLPDLRASSLSGGPDVSISPRNSIRGIWMAGIGVGRSPDMGGAVPTAHWTLESRLFTSLISSCFAWRSEDITASEKTRARVSKRVPRGANVATTDRYCPVICLTSNAPRSL